MFHGKKLNIATIKRESLSQKFVQKQKEILLQILLEKLYYRRNIYSGI